MLLLERPSIISDYKLIFFFLNTSVVSFSIFKYLAHWVLIIGMVKHRVSFFPTCLPKFFQYMNLWNKYLFLTDLKCHLYYKLNACINLGEFLIDHQQ